MAQTFLATDPLGEIHTRTSESRTYTHTVVRLVKAYTEADIAADGEGWAQAAKRNYKFHTDVANGLHDDYYEGPNDHGRKAEIVAFIKRCPTVEAAMAEARAKGIERGKEIARTSRAADYYENIGWCGRSDLAQKLAAKSADTVILVATIKQKK